MYGLMVLVRYMWWAYGYSNNSCAHSGNLDVGNQQQGYRSTLSILVHFLIVVVLRKAEVWRSTPHDRFGGGPGELIFGEV